MATVAIFFTWLPRSQTRLQASSRYPSEQMGLGTKHDRRPILGSFSIRSQDKLEGWRHICDCRRNKATMVDKKGQAIETIKAIVAITWSWPQRSADIHLMECFLNNCFGHRIFFSSFFSVLRIHVRLGWCCVEFHHRTVLGDEFLSRPVSSATFLSKWL